MAHEVTVYNAKKITPTNELVFFFGYANGFFYDVFKANHLNNGISGNGGSVIMQRDEFMQCIDMAKEDMYEQMFVNPTEIWDFLNKVEKLQYEEFGIQFS